MRILLLTNGIYAIPVIQQLCQKQADTVVGLTNEQHPGIAQVAMACQQLGVETTTLAQQSLDEQISQLIKGRQQSLVICCGFPWKISDALLGIDEVGFLNIHLAKLPQYRGPHPVFWQLKNREEEGAVCIHQLSPSLDDGPILSMKPVPITEEDTHGMHMIKAAVKAAEMLGQIWLELKSGNWKYRLRPQPSEGAAYHPRPTEMDLLIDWQKMSGAEVVALIKACNPWNQGAFTALNGSQIKIVDARLMPEEEDAITALPGLVLSADRDQGIYVATADKRKIKIEVVSLEEGIFPGGALTLIGLAAGSRFDSAPLLAMAGSKA